MRWIYLSPHLDDAVLSCGGLIWEQTRTGIPVEIWTICAGDPPPGEPSSMVVDLHLKWNSGSPTETVRLRRSEDQNAARRVGATAVHFPIPDCIYRRSKTGSLYYPDQVFTFPQPTEQTLISRITELLTDRLTRYDTLVCPLAIGGHVDHRITRAAAEQLNRPLWYYADIPYHLNFPAEITSTAENLAPKNFFTSAQGLSAWQDAIAAYASQLTGLFVDEQDMRQKIRTYCHENDGITLLESDPS